MSRWSPARRRIIVGRNGSGVIAPFFTDGFESGDFSHTENGAAWTGSDADVTVQSGRGTGGSYSAQFRFNGVPPGSDCAAEKRFDLGALYTELTLMFDLYIPNGGESWGGAAYTHRGDTPNNNKFFRLWPETYSDDTQVGASLFYTTDSGVVSKIRSEWVEFGDLSVGEHGQARTELINSSDLGAWMQIKIYCRMDPGDGTGSMRIYKNNALVIDNSNVMDNYHVGYPAGWRYGYLLGWANSGFDSTTYLQIDNVRFYSGAV